MFRHRLVSFDINLKLSLKIYPQNVLFIRRTCNQLHSLRTIRVTRTDSKNQETYPKYIHLFQLQKMWICDCFSNEQGGPFELLVVLCQDIQLRFLKYQSQSYSLFLLTTTSEVTILRTTFVHRFSRRICNRLHNRLTQKSCTTVWNIFYK